MTQEIVPHRYRYRDKARPGRRRTRAEGQGRAVVGGRGDAHPRPPPSGPSASGSSPSSTPTIQQPRRTGRPKMSIGRRTTGRRSSLTRPGARRRGEDGVGGLGDRVEHHGGSRQLHAHPPTPLRSHATTDAQGRTRPSLTPEVIAKAR
ncbi:hypothetical protein THAOC_25931, partial [Thalassiosira oceanica]